MRRCAACSLSSKRVRGLPLRPDRLAPDLAAQEVTLEIIKPTANDGELPAQWAESFLVARELLSFQASCSSGSRTKAWSNSRKRSPSQARTRRKL